MSLKDFPEQTVSRFLMIGALLGRTDEDIIVPTVGGCDIGRRPVDFHIDALEKLGAVIEYREMKKEGAYFAHAHDGLKGTVDYTCLSFSWSYRKYDSSRRHRKRHHGH